MITTAATPKVVGVIFTLADLQHAGRLRNPPDLFELRLDALFARRREIDAALGHLRAPLIITARHPREGGLNQLSARQRHALLRRFLPRAAYVDIELRAAHMFAAILEEARKKSIRTVLSFHDLDETPSRPVLEEIARAAQSLGANVLKVATRTDTPNQVARLLDFSRQEWLGMKIAAMGIGRLGRSVRRELFRQGSIFNYVHLGRRLIAGQPSLSDIRRWTARASGGELHNPMKLHRASGTSCIIAVAEKVPRVCRVPVRRAAHQEHAKGRRR